MSLYDGLGVEKDQTKAAGWSSSFDMLKTQLQVVNCFATIMLTTYLFQFLISIQYCQVSVNEMMVGFYVYFEAVLGLLQFEGCFEGLGRVVGMTNRVSSVRYVGLS